MQTVSVTLFQSHDTGGHSVKRNTKALYTEKKLRVLLTQYTLIKCHGIDNMTLIRVYDTFVFVLFFIFVKL